MIHEIKLLSRYFGEKRVGWESIHRKINKRTYVKGVYGYSWIRRWICSHGYNAYI